jgi:hypothetical protein
MQRAETTTTSFSNSPFYVPQNAGEFSVVLVYEDLETGKRARKVYDFLAGNLGEDCQCRLQMWKFDVLAIPKLRDIATRDAAEADLLIVSMRGSHALAEPVTVWIESWLAVGTRAMALVAMVDASPEESSASEETCAYLGRVARRANMEFFAHPDMWPSSILPGMTVGNLSASVPMNSYSMPHWGINE